MERPNRANRIECSPRELPNVLDYLDYRVFMRDRLDGLQQQDRKYSQRWVAKHAGIKSPQLLSMIVSGQRQLAAAKAQDVAGALKLVGQEIEYFETIVALAHSETQDERQRVLEKIKTTFKNGLFSSISDAGLEIFRFWYLPAIRELVTLKSFEPTPAWIALQLRITEDEAKDGLALLTSTGFLRQEGERYLRAEPSVHSPDKVYPLLLASYNLQLLEQTFKAHGYARDKRYFESLIFAMPTRLLPHLSDMIRRFFREVDMLVESHDEREEVCLLNVQLFPLTPWTNAKPAR